MPIRSGAAAFNVQEEFFGNAGFHRGREQSRTSCSKRSAAPRTAIVDTVLCCLGRCCCMLVPRNRFFSTQLTLRAWSDQATEPNRKIWVGFSAECGDNEQGYDIVLCWRGTMVRVHCNLFRLRRACGHRGQPRIPATADCAGLCVARSMRRNGRSTCSATCCRIGKRSRPRARGGCTGKYGGRPASISASGSCTARTTPRQCPGRRRTVLVRCP